MYISNFFNFLIILFEVFSYVWNHDISLTTPEVARTNGYMAQIYHVKTEDDYILEIHRIYSNNSNPSEKQPVLLLHGFFDNSKDRVNAENVSLAFLLADEGYDVWLGNFRGNVYSQSHVKYYITNPKFWNYSFDEMSYYDVPAFINCIQNNTNTSNEIFAICHSEGCASLYAYTSVFPNISYKNIKVAVTMAPAVYLGHVTALIKYPVILLIHNQWIFRDLGITHLNVQDISQFIAYRCDDSKAANFFCRLIFPILFGFNANKISSAYLPDIYSHYGNSASVNEGIHLGQLIESDNFQMFDYGVKKNLIIYKSKKPPIYKLHNVRLPTYIFYGTSDDLVKEKDTSKLASNLPNNKLFKGINGYTHGDFLYAEDVRTQVYYKIINIFRKYLPST